MKKKSLILIFSLFIVALIVLLIVRKKNDVDITNTNFVYHENLCDEYFNLLECIIDKDTDETYTKQMRIDLKNEVKMMQERWMQLSEDDLARKCKEELDQFDNDVMKEKLASFRCSLK